MKNKDSTTLYLKKLRFDEKLRNKWIAKYLSNSRFVILLIVAILAIGISSFISLPRRLNPEVQFPLIIISTVLQGANPEDIESLITQPIESSVESLSDVKEVTSVSQENVSIVTVEFTADVDTDKARSDVQSATDTVQLPDDALEPNVTDIDFENEPVWSFAVIGPDSASLSRFSETLKNNLEDSPNIKEVSVNGFETQEIAIILNPSTIANFGINPIQLSQQISAATGSYPAGNVRSNTLSFPLSIDPAVTSVEDIRNIQISVQGEVIPLSMLATIQEISKPNQLQSFYADRDIPGQQAVTFDVFKTQSSDIDSAVRVTEEIIDETNASYGQQFSIRTITNSGELVSEQFNDLLRDFSITVFLVFLTLFIFLGARQAFVAFIAVPFTFLITFGVMQYTGITLNFLSMFSLLLSLGLLVDDTIVVISATTAYYKTGKFTPIETGLLVWRDFGIPIVTTTLTTVFAFVPLLLATGIIGEFIKSIPIVVSSTLLASLFVGLIVTLPLMLLLLQPNIPNRVKIFFRIILGIGFAVLYFAITPKDGFILVSIFAFFIFVFVLMITREQLIGSIKQRLSNKKSRFYRVLNRTTRYSNSGVISFSIIESKYRNVLSKIIIDRKNRRNTIIIVLLFSLFSYLLVPLGFVKNEFFPKSDQEFLFATLEFPAGTNLNTSKDEALKLLRELRTTPDVEYVILNMGRATGQTGFTSSGENTALFSLVLPDSKNRDRSSIEIAESLRSEYDEYPLGNVVITEVSGGPPAGADIQIKLFGNELDQLNIYADRIVEYLEEQEGVADPTKSVKSGASKLVFVPDAQKAAQYGISTDQIGLWLRTFASGFTLDTIKFPDSGNEDTDITLRLSEDQRVEDIYSLSIPTPQGLVALTDLGEIRLDQNPSQITRENGQRTISVSASTRPGFASTEINTELENFADNQLNLLPGYSWATGGVNEENQQSVNSILQAMVLSFLLIIVTMVVQFGSFRKAIIVMLVIPLSISGVFIIFGLAGIPLSFPALIGILALFGIVVKNSILIVDKIAANETVGMSFEESIIDASVSRLEAIALTSVTAIFGLIPITLSDPLWRGLGGAIIAGLTFSGTIMLFFIPVVYYYWFAPKIRVKRKAGKVKKESRTSKKK